LRIHGNGDAGFAEIRSPSQAQDRPETEQPRGFSQDSQNSQGLPQTTHLRLRVVSGYRPHRLDVDAADICHAGGWDDPETARFQSRVVLFQRRGIAEQDAEDRAERLTLRDCERDDRRLCLECRHYRHSRCGNHKRAGLASAEVGRTLAATLQRCPGFQSSEVTT
jgi:hypothetical protein